MQKQYFSIAEAKDILGATYDQVWYACATGRVRPEIVGRTRLLTQEDIHQLRTLFERRKKWKK